MGFQSTQRVTIDLDPRLVRDEVTDALEAEIRRQADEDLPDDLFLDTFVADASDGLDSHAVVSFDPIGGSRSTNDA
jgi:hypothetical protein